MIPELSFDKKIPYASIALAAVNVLVFIVFELTGSTGSVAFMYDHGALYGPAVMEGEYYRLFTAMFLHFGAAHLMNNMLMLYLLGERLESVVGAVRFLVIYLAGGALANVFTVFAYNALGVDAVSAGASGAVFAAMGGMFGCMVRARGGLTDIGFKRMIILIVLAVYSGFSAPGTNNTAHVSGLVFGFLLGLLLYTKRNGER